MPPSSILIVGGSGGLGSALVKHYAEAIGNSHVYATIRGQPKPGQFPSGINVITDVDVSKKDCGDKVVAGLGGKQVDVVVYVSGILKGEEFGKANWDDEIAMYTICAVAPVIVIEKLVTSSSISPHGKVVFLTSEGGSITLRTEGEGGGMYGHHGSKAAANMVGHLLGYDLKKKGIPIVMVHPGFLKTEMTKGAGMEEFYEKMGAVTPDEAAVPFADFIEKVNLDMTGQFWAPMGGRGIGNAEEVLGKAAAEQTSPLRLPW